MKRFLKRTFAIFLLFGATLPGALNAATKDLSDQFVVADGLEITLWAESPQLFKPTNIDVDYRGRIWVAEGVNYRKFRGPDINQPESQHLRHPAGDRIMILEDTDGDGVCDSSRVFVQDPDLVAPLGVAVIGNRVFVSCSPNLIVYTLDQSGDKPAKKEIFLTGFGGRDHDHGLHSVVAGPDGRLYFNAGNAGPHIVTDQGGKTIRVGSVYNGGSPHVTNNTPNLKSDDGRVWTGGVALRVDPSGRNLTVLAHNFRNSYEVAIDSFGNLWQSDNDDEVRSCRMSWVMEGGNMGFFSADGTRTWRADQRPGQSIQTAQWHQDDPGVVPAGDIYGAGGPTGVVIYEGDLLPKKFQGMVLNADAGRNTVFGHIPHPDGAGYRLERTIFLTSRRESTEGYRWDKVSVEDKSTWFRPSDVAVGTDGAVYIADWYDQVVGGHAMRSTNGYGRILRVAPKGSKPRAPKIDVSKTKGQIAALCSPAINVRYLGWEKLTAYVAHEAGLLERIANWDGIKSLKLDQFVKSKSSPFEKADSDLKDVLKSENPFIKARIAWLSQGTPKTGLASKAQNFEPTAASFRQIRTCFEAWLALESELISYEKLRGPGSGASARTLINRQKAEFWNRTKKLAVTASAPMRRDVAIAMRDFSFVNSREVLLSLFESYDGKDRFYLEALGTGSDGKEEAIHPEILAKLGNPDSLKWSEAFANLVWRLHPVACIPAVATRAKSDSLSEAARKQAVDTLAFIKHRDAANAMVDLALNSSSDVIRTNALWWARFRAGNDWKEFDVASRLPSTAPTAAERAARAKLQSLRSTLLNAQAARAVRENAATSLAATKEGGLLLLNLAIQARLPSELTEAISEAIFRNPDLSVRALASQYFKRPSRSGEAFPPMAELVKMPGEAARGKKIFQGDTASCYKCHAFAGSGGDVGPDLTMVRTKLGKEAILDSILNPSAVIAAGYEPWLIETKDGESYSGFILSAGDMVTLKESSGERRSIPSRNIASRQQLKLSLMPDNIAVGMMPQDLADVVEFLMSSGDK